MQRQFLDSQSKCVITNEENLDRVLKAVNGCPKVTVWRENSLKPVTILSWILDSHLREVDEKAPTKRSLLLRTSHIDAYRLDTQIPIQVCKRRFFAILTPMIFQCRRYLCPALLKRHDGISEGRYALTSDCRNNAGRP